MKKILESLDFFQVESVSSEIFDLLKFNFDVSKTKLFVLIGVSSNSFFKVFDKELFDKLKSCVLGLNPKENDYQLKIQTNSNDDIKQFIFITSWDNQLVPEMIDAIKLFEFAIIYLAKEEYDESYLSRKLQTFSLVSPLSRKRWIKSDSYLGIDMNLLHNRISLNGFGSYG